MAEKLPIIFVTGIGQTWSKLKDNDDFFWNMVPTNKEVMMKGATLGTKLQIASFALSSYRSLKHGSGNISEEKLKNIVNFLLKYVIVDERGKLPEDVDVRIYGARPFSELKNIDLATDKHTDDFSKSIMKRVYKDIPCEELAEEYGADKVYCFNYSTFSDLYDNAHKLRKMIEEVLKRHTDCDKVVLVPMSMGATVVNAYLDEYYKEGVSVGKNVVKRVVSIVGAWDGSDALADILEKKFNASFYKMLEGKEDGNKAEKYLSKFKKPAVKNAVNILVDTFIECVLLRVSSFAALIPNERFEEVTKEIFTEKRLKDARIVAVKEEYDRYFIAQSDLKERLYDIRDKSEVEFSFISGYNLDFGGVKSDFGFLGYVQSAGHTNTDSVIQISSTAPGTYYVESGHKLDPDSIFSGVNCNDSSHNHFSPELSLCGKTAYFPESTWYFEGQEHELGTNNTALKLAIGIAAGDVKDVHDERYPQFNSSRNVTKAKKAMEEAQKKLNDNTVTVNEKEIINKKLEAVKNMLNCTINNREKDEAVVNELESVLK